MAKKDETADEYPSGEVGEGGEAAAWPRRKNKGGECGILKSPSYPTVAAALEGDAALLEYD